jgi:hypothetical protein
MEDDDPRRGPWQTKGTYLNHMLHCGSRYNGWVQEAVEYLPEEVLWAYRDRLAFISTGESDGCRVARALCENREIIVLSERILPKRGMNEAAPEVRYFIFVVLHEVAHAFLEHRSPMFDGITPEENEAQEAEADALALGWFNDRIKEKAHPDLGALDKEQISVVQSNYQAEMKNRYEL